MCVFTIGHSTRSAEAFLALLREFEIRRLVDVRHHPGSRSFPHFNRQELQAWLAPAGVEYEWLPALGGRRSSGLAPSPNPGLRNASFRNYADHMLTAEFRAGVEQLLAGAAAARTAFMCAEAVYWRCHRRLISDYLLARGVEVLHIVGPGQLRPHALTPGALAGDGTLVYPAPPVDPAQPTLFP